MIRCPQVTNCINCDKPLIHKGTRLHNESASELGQIVYNVLPHEFTWIDIDGALYRRSIRLLRIFEHKSPGQHRKGPQRELLELLAKIVEHIKNCADANQEFRLHEQSGVYLIEGDPQDGNQLGPSKIIRLHDGKIKQMDELQTLCWIPLFKHEYDIERVRENLSRHR